MQGRRENNQVVEAVSVEFQKYPVPGFEKEPFSCKWAAARMKNVPLLLLEVPDVKV